MKQGTSFPKLCFGKGEKTLEISLAQSQIPTKNYETLFLPPKFSPKT
jgi:hypothetical protein